MIQLLIIISTSVLLSISYRKKIQLLFPVIAMGEVLVMYTFALFVKNLTICTFISLTILSVFAIVSFCISKSTISKDDIYEFIFTPQIGLLLIVCLFFFFLFSNRKVFNWDDLSYWGIYAKDLFYLNKLPVGAENCTIAYKDYMPIMQLAQEFIICLNSSFYECRPFQINICFLYILMLPFLDSLDQDKGWYSCLGSIVLYIVFPHVFTTQFYCKLGVDYLISLLFGYGLYMIKRDNFRVSTYRTIAMVTISSFLALIKSSGIVISLFLLVFYVFCTVDINGRSIIRVREKKYAFNIVLVVFIPISFYFSWKIWGRISSNHGYLSDKVNSNIRSMNFSFPDYSKSVIIDYIKHCFNYPLTRNRYGITAFIVLLCIIALYFIQKMHLVKNNSEIAVFRRMNLLSLIGLIIFCIAHIYMYLFVFDDWEAFGLLEFDRYICQYLAGLFYYHIYSLCEYSSIVIGQKHRKINLAIPFFILFIVLLPYSSINRYLIPKHYNTYYENEWKPFRDCALQELDQYNSNNLIMPYDNDHRLMMIGNAWLDEFQYFSYELVPQPITIVANIPALENGTLYNYVCSLSENNNIKYIYVMSGVGQYYSGNFLEESKELTFDHKPLTGGRIYIRDDINDNVIYKLFN